MNEILEQFATNPLGRLVLHQMATGGLWNRYRFLLVAARLSGVFLVVPWFQQTTIPLSVRAIFVVLLSLIVAPTLSAKHSDEGDITVTSHDSSRSNSVPASITEIGVLFVGEVALGTLMGFGLLGFVAGLRFAGEWLDRHSGLGMGTVFNPDWLIEGNACSSTTQLLGIAAFLSMEPVGGHLRLLQTLLQSFHAIPVGEATWTMSAFEISSHLVQQSFYLGLGIAMPLVAILTLVDVAMAFVSRASPASLNSSCIAIRTGISLFVLALTMTAIPELIETTTSHMLEQLGVVH